MVFRTHTHDLTDRVEEIEQRLDELEREQDEILTEIENELEEDEDLDDAPDSLKDEWEDLEREKIEISGERRKFMDAVVHWMTDVDVTENPSEETVEEAYENVEECVFKSEELSYGQIQAVNDDMMEKSFELDVEGQDLDGTPKQGFMQIELIREALIDWPDQSPVRSTRRSEEAEPGDYPEPVADWLFNRIDALNTTQEEEMGNTSLTEAMNSR